MVHMYFVHDWILDVDRVTKWFTILSDLMAISDRLDVGLIALGGENSQGYTYTRFLIAVPSLEALRSFVEVAAQWGFKEWEQVHEDNEFVYLFTSPQYKIIAHHMRPENCDPSLMHATIDGLWGAAYRNEIRRTRQGQNQ